MLIQLPPLRFSGSPIFFPFTLADLSAQQFSRFNPRLEAIQQGLNQDVLMLLLPVSTLNGTTK